MERRLTIHGFFDSNPFRKIILKKKFKFCDVFLELLFIGERGESNLVMIGLDHVKIFQAFYRGFDCYKIATNAPPVEDCGLLMWATTDSFGRISFYMFNTEGEKFFHLAIHPSDLDRLFSAIDQVMKEKN